MKMYEVSWAEVAPDVYSGDECDDIRHSWSGSAEGDMSGPEQIGDILTFDARTFPPGTKVVVSVPLCPQCGESSDMYFPHKQMPKDDQRYPEFKCDCGFDWKQWTTDTYS